MNLRFDVQALFSRMDCQRTHWRLTVRPSEASVDWPEWRNRFG